MRLSPPMYVMLPLLSLALLSAEAGAQPAGFDPRSWRAGMAGPPTEIVVLGTLHLGQLKPPLKDSFGPALVAPLLDKLAAFKPTIITIEALSGESCDLITTYKAVYPDVANTYCYTTEAAQKATGLTVPAAEAEVAKRLGTWPAQPSPADRRHLAAVLLAANDRASAAVQWLRLPETERHAGDGLDAALVGLLDEIKGKSNENISIAAALAARLGLERVYAVDDHTADRITAASGEDFEKAIKQLWSAPPSKIRQETLRREAAITSGGELLDYYRFINQPSTLIDAIQSDFGAAIKQQTPALYGRQYVAWWETRNLRMVANIREAFGNQPGARVLAIVGSSHKPYFEAYLGMMHEVKLVDVEAILK